MVALPRRCAFFGFFALAACGSPSSRSSRVATEQPKIASETTVATLLALPIVGENVLLAADAPLFPSAAEAEAHPATAPSPGSAVVAYEVRAVVGDVLEVLTTLEEIDDCGEYIPVDRGDPRGGYAIVAYVPLAAAIPRLAEAESRGTTVAARGAPLRRRGDGRGVFLDGALAARLGAVSASKIARSTPRGTAPTPVLGGQEPVVCTPTATTEAAIETGGAALARRGPPFCQLAAGSPFADLEATSLFSAFFERRGDLVLRADRTCGTVFEIVAHDDVIASVAASPVVAPGPKLWVAAGAPVRWPDGQPAGAVGKVVAHPLDAAAVVGDQTCFRLAPFTERLCVPSSSVTRALFAPPTASPE